MTAPTQRAGGLDANARGIAVLAAAVVIGFLLLLKAGGTGDASEVTTGATPTTVDTSNIGGGETTTTVAGGAATTTSTTAPGGTSRPAGEVSVLVLNADGPAGSAGATSQTIGAAGYQMGEATNANADVSLEATAVYYAEGYQTEATAVAAVLGKEPSVVAPLPSPAPGPGADEANVVVVLGADASPVADGDSSGTTTSTSTPG